MRMASGPECPRCGCKDSRVERVRARWGGKSASRRICSHCSRAWTSTEAEERDAARLEPEKPAGPKVEPIIYWVAVAPSCPYCGSERTLVTHTMRPIRHHKCPECERSFKSSERSPV